MDRWYERKDRTLFHSDMGNRRAVGLPPSTVLAPLLTLHKNGTYLRHRTTVG